MLLLDSPGIAYHDHQPPTPAERRERLILAYGYCDSLGRPVPVCAFCGTTTGSIEVEHLLPTSRGGTEAWENLALACRACNQRKGAQTPEEAGMQLLLHHSLRSQRRGRLRPYVDGTLRALRGHLRELNLIAIRPGGAEGNRLAQDVMSSVLSKTADNTPFPEPIIAYPVPRPRKQRFSSRNYRLSTSSRADLVRVGRAIKRLVRVNQSLRLNRGSGQVRVQAILAGDNQAPGKPDASLLIRPGMLCSAARAGIPVAGVVSAIHSSGRLTLRVPVGASPEAVIWRPVVISPRRDLRVLSTDRVVFIRPKPIEPT
ncbi:HNH endonuclease [Oscillochloris sp. ZM17-4]|uniref:HNH endonuclease n=1 Tax=Oscillochloris sp. ZM17-4 TaxID=2866714 RepID=UPI0021062D0D|nr:HNH endonuclease [Oscillochloris sp. ZM17-4]